LGDFLPGAGDPKWSLSNIEFGKADTNDDKFAHAVAWATEQKGMETWMASQSRESRHIWDRYCRKSAEILATEAQVPWKPKCLVSAEAKDVAAPKFSDPNMLNPENPFLFGVYPDPSLIPSAISGPRFFIGPSGGM
jgi:hypothetical protein